MSRNVAAFQQALSPLSPSVVERPGEAEEREPENEVGRSFKAVKRGELEEQGWIQRKWKALGLRS